eukprot:GHRQ01020556.1.p1 GENE.GHRQ01020556.1~~GHRQ01020556.1.p1  ORF type:complete len:242 (-),score=48.83 GHRQ01020556.1:845-1570(-)
MLQSAMMQTCCCATKPQAHQPAYHCNPSSTSLSPLRLTAMQARLQPFSQPSCAQLDVLLHVQSEYWNLGASSRRWIAPEHRHLAPHSPTPQCAAAATAAREVAAAAGGAAATSTVPPWAMHCAAQPSAVSAGAPHAAMPSPWATHMSAAQLPGARQAAAVVPPWATTASQPARSTVAGSAGAGDRLQRPGNSAGSITGGRDNSSVRPHTAAGAGHGPSHSQHMSYKPQPVGCWKPDVSISP